MVGESFGDVNIPLDLNLEILKKLPAKSMMRFLSVSKLWRTIIKDYIVKHSIVTQSLTQRDPHFIFQRVLSSTLPKFSIAYSYHQTAHKEELLSLDETYLKEGYCIREFQYVRGLIGYIRYKSSPHGYYPRFTIHNLTTRQSLHYTQSYNKICYFFLGYDALSNQYKVVCLERIFSTEMYCRVYTLGNSKKQWRNIPCGIESHYPSSSRGSVCINGVIYYKAYMNSSYVLVSVDVVSERFNHVQSPEEVSICLGDATLVDYKGKLGCICKDNLNMDLWVLENTDEWSKITYVDVFRDIPSCFGVAGITHPDGEIVIVSQSQGVTPITVYYYDMKFKKSRRVEIKTSMSSRETISIMKVITDPVENIMFLS